MTIYTPGIFKNIDSIIPSSFYFYTFPIQLNTLSDAIVFYSSKSTSQPVLHNAKFDNNSNTLHVIYRFCNLHSKILYLIFLVLQMLLHFDFSLKEITGVILLPSTFFSVDVNGIT